MNFCYVLYLCSLSFAVLAKQDGIDHQLIEKNGHRIHLVTVDPVAYKIISVRADNDSAKEVVSTLTKKFGADIGINGGFFYVNKEGKARPSGVLRIENQWHGLARKPKDAIGWDNNNSVLIDKILTKKNKQNEIEVVPLLDSSSTAKEKWQQFPYIVGGSPILIKNGKAFFHFAKENSSKSFFLEQRHARTAVCIKDNGEWVFLVGSHTKDADRPYVNQVVEGLTIEELTQVLQEINCKQAINLDGGGSTTLVLNNKVINSPAGDMDDILHLFHERSVSDAILVVKR